MYLCTFVHTYIHTFLHTYIHTCIHAYIHTYIHGVYAPLSNVLARGFRVERFGVRVEVLGFEDWL